MKLDEAKDILLKEGYLLEDNSDIMNNFSSCQREFDQICHDLKINANDYMNGNLDRDTFVKNLTNLRYIYSNFDKKFKKILVELSFDLEAYKE